MGAPGFHIVELRPGSVISGQSNASRIDNPHSAGKGNDPRDMGMPAEDERRLNTSEPLLDLLSRSLSNMIPIDLFQKVLQIVRRRTMAEQHIFGQHLRWRQSGEPLQ